MQLRCPLSLARSNGVLESLFFACGEHLHSLSNIMTISVLPLKAAVCNGVLPSLSGTIGSTLYSNTSFLAILRSPYMEAKWSGSWPLYPGRVGLQLNFVRRRCTTAACLWVTAKWRGASPCLFLTIGSQLKIVISFSTTLEWPALAAIWSGVYPSVSTSISLPCFPDISFSISSQFPLSQASWREFCCLGAFDEALSVLLNSLAPVIAFTISGCPDSNAMSSGVFPTKSWRVMSAPSLCTNTFANKMKPAWQARCRGVCNAMFTLSTGQLNSLTNTSLAPACPDVAAWWRGVPPQSSHDIGSQLNSVISILIRPVWPFWAAQCSGVCPPLLLISGGVPKSVMSFFTTSMLPCSAAIWRGVAPWWSLESGSWSPWEINLSTRSAPPTALAICRNDFSCWIVHLNSLTKTSITGGCLLYNVANWKGVCPSKLTESGGQLNSFTRALITSTWFRSPVKWKKPWEARGSRAVFEVFSAGGEKACRAALWRALQPLSSGSRASKPYCDISVRTRVKCPPAAAWCNTVVFEIPLDPRGQFSLLIRTKNIFECP